MKIYQVVPYYPPHLGGMEIFVQRLSEGLAKKGHDVSVFTTSNVKVESISKNNAVRIISLKKMSHVYNVPIVPSLFWRLINEEKPDIINAHQYPIFFSDISAWVSQLRNIPFVLWVHVVSDPKSPLSGLISNTYYSTIGKFPFEMADSIISPTLAYKQKLIDMGTKAKKIQVIPYGIDVEKFYYVNKSNVFKERYNCEGSTIILSVGRLNYQKGFKFLIKAMPGILRRIPDAKLIIVGEGEQLSELENLVKSLDLFESVIFTGALAQKEIPMAYATADIFVLPSLFESFGISLIEAQAAGKPVIGTKTGGVPEALIDGKTGLLVEPGDPKQLEVAILKVLLNKKLQNEFGNNGYDFAKSRYSIQTTIETVSRTYNKIMR